jgi:hypothetical protein
MSDALGQCSDCGFATYPGNATARPWFRFAADDVVFVKNGQGDRVTTRGLFESATTAGELLIYLHLSNIVRTSSVREMAMRTIRALWREHSTYGATAKLFCEVVRISPESFARAIPTFAVATDIALNPPVPPIQVEVVAPISWDQFYPPIRFFRVASAVRAVGLLHENADDASVYEYWHKLASASGLPMAPEGAHPVTRRRPKCDFAVAADSGVTGIKCKSSPWPVVILAAEAERARTTPRRSAGRPEAERRQGSRARLRWR